MNTGPYLSVLLLTEDRASQADATLEALARKMFRYIDPGCDLQPSKVSFEPATDPARLVARANNWKDSTRRDLAYFRQYIATQLSLAHGFVVFHIDGDRVYAEHASSENRRKFDEMIRKHVRTILEGPPRKRRERTTPVQTPPPSVEERLAKLFLLLPCYSIEAWTFQNTTVATRLCRQNPSCPGRCLEHLAKWQADRGALDEVDKPKTKLCFQDKHNAELAGSGYPMAAVVAAGKSLHDAVKPMRENPALLSALARTREHPTTC